MVKQFPVSARGPPLQAREPSVSAIGSPLSVIGFPVSAIGFPVSVLEGPWYRLAGFLYRLEGRLVGSRDLYQLYGLLYRPGRPKCEPDGPVSRVFYIRQMTSYICQRASYIGPRISCWAEGVLHRPEDVI